MRFAFRLLLNEPPSQIQDITTMSLYKGDFPFSVAFPPQRMTNVLAEWLSKHEIKQCHIAGRQMYRNRSPHS